jgi:hypothetical protein
VLWYKKFSYVYLLARACLLSPILLLNQNIFTTSNVCRLSMMLVFAINACIVWLFALCGLCLLQS